LYLHRRFSNYALKKRVVEDSVFSAGPAEFEVPFFVRRGEWKPRFQVPQWRPWARQSLSIFGRSVHKIYGHVAPPVEPDD